MSVLPAATMMVLLRESIAGEAWLSKEGDWGRGARQETWPVLRETAKSANSRGWPVGCVLPRAKTCDALATGVTCGIQVMERP
jgi:hypothetical protein